MNRFCSNLLVFLLAICLLIGGLLACKAGIQAPDWETKARIQAILFGGLAEDDWRSPRVVDYINATDDTPRNDWQKLAPELLRACEDALAYLGASAFCYVLPAYLRQYLLRPSYMCTDSIFFYMDHTRKGQYLDSLSPTQQTVVEAVFNEYRCREWQINGEPDAKELLPWEFERCRQAGYINTPVRFAEMLAQNYAERHGIRLSS